MKIEEARRIVQIHDDIENISQKLEDWHQYKNDLVNDDSLEKLNTMMAGIYYKQNGYQPPANVQGSLKISTKLKLNIVEEQIENLQKELKLLNSQI
jgi:hypothetical protein